MNMHTKLRIGILCGGQSGEHEVSLASAQAVIDTLDKNKYEVITIGIDKQGRWLTNGQVQQLWTPDTLQLPLPGVESAVDSEQLPLFAAPSLVSSERLSVNGEQSTVIREGAIPAETVTALVAANYPHRAARDTAITNHQLPITNSHSPLANLDVVFPVLHGPMGEDGTVQGLLELAHLPYVGAGVAASAVGMDKALMKSIFTAQGLPVVPYTVILRSLWDGAPENVMDDLEARLAYPVFVKPANLGSSVGVSKARNRSELNQAIVLACQYDRKILVEQALRAREVECSVLGNDEPIVSVVGEIRYRREFYDYVAKYTDGEADLIIPAALPHEQAEAVRALALRAYRAIDCAGMARADFFIDQDTNRIYINELNTIPGFTKFSMYPKLWEATGISYGELLDRLIRLALERHQDKKRSGL
jgi:D-alanine-D-alanine ligase